MPGDGVLGWVVGVGVPALYVLGLASAYDAVMKARTAQGATAWALGLITVPLVALPLYWVFGRVKFSTYVRALRDFYRELDVRLDDPRRGVLATHVAHPERRADARGRGELNAFHELATLPFTRHNAARLLVDGQATFEAIFAGIEAAERYVLAQFYILRDDDIGRAFQRRLIAKAQAGVRVYLLYDEVGCYGLPKPYLHALEEAGVRVSSFSGRRSWRARFRLNFRNHRKIVVVDGVRGYMGGLNVGDEYLGRDPEIGPWRDTHLALEGPAVQGIQYAFLKDWYYGREEVLDVEWEATPAEADLCALVLASGPADTLETCGLLYAHAIESAEERVWIATPYFVPDGAVLGALQLAALRGVDVRLIMPRKTDAWMFKYVPYAYLPDVTRAGVKAYLYEEGFMHQKVLLVDDDYAAVSTANLDNRSFRLNFELTVLVHDRGFCGAVERMLEKDLARATAITEADLQRHPFFFRLAVQTTRLMSPVL
jgi:cardiolipin synthase